MGVEVSNVSQQSEKEFWPEVLGQQPISRPTVALRPSRSDPGIMIEGLKAEKEELRMECLNLRQRVLDLELGESALHRQISDLKSHIEEQVTSASPAVARDEREFAGERDEDRLLEEGRENSELNAKIRKLERELAREVERGREWEKEREEAQTKIQHLEDIVSQAGAQIWTDASEMRDDAEKMVIENAHMALRNSEISSLQREVRVYVLSVRNVCSVLSRQRMGNFKTSRPQ